jgi:hypothetical protein
MLEAPMKSEVKTATDRAPETPQRTAVVNSRDIAARAYDLYIARGRTDGHDVEDWLQAEEELGTAAEL